MSVTPPSGPEPTAPPPDLPLSWPLSEVDRSPAAARRRGLAFFHVVVLLMAGGIWALVPGPWVIAAGVVWLVTLSYSARRHIPTMVHGMTGMDPQPEP